MFKLILEYFFIKRNRIRKLLKFLEFPQISEKNLKNGFAL
jgi:hypothetical protein